MEDRRAHRAQWSVAARGILCGIVGGLLVVLYRSGMSWSIEWAHTMYDYLKANPHMIAVWALIAVWSATFIAFLVAWEPMATGSGIPQVDGVLLHGLHMRWWSVLTVRFIAGWLCGLFGLSLGREGPSIQIGAAGSQPIAGRFAKNDIEKSSLITGGAAAGLSAAFSAPLSGMMFALEEVHHSFSATILLTATTAALTADYISKLFLGLTPVLKFATVPELPLNSYMWLIPLGLATGLMGSAMNKLLLGMQTIYRRIRLTWRIVIAFGLALPMGLFFPLVLGGGDDLIHYAETATGSTLFLAVLLLLKMLFTSTSFGSGLPGGIFMPILTVGAVTGSLFANIVTQLPIGTWGLSPQQVATFTVLAMAGVLASSVKAPITAMLLVIEMTGSLVHMFPVAAVTFIALLVSDALHIEPIYHVLLQRFMGQPDNEK